MKEGRKEGIKKKNTQQDKERYSTKRKEIVKKKEKETKQM